MLIGVVLHRSSALQGNLDFKIYMRMIIIGNYKHDIALVRFIPNKLGIIPLGIAYIGLFSLLNKKIPSKVATYVKACGRWLSQTTYSKYLRDNIFRNYFLKRRFK